VDVGTHRHDAEATTGKSVSSTVGKKTAQRHKL
jgi:hypothetical protein